MQDRNKKLTGMRYGMFSWQIEYNENTDIVLDLVQYNETYIREKYKLHLPAESQKIFMGGKSLSNEELLGPLKLYKHNTLHMVPYIKQALTDEQIIAALQANKLYWMIYHHSNEEKTLAGERYQIDYVDYQDLPKVLVAIRNRYERNLDYKKNVTPYLMLVAIPPQELTDCGEYLPGASGGIYDGLRVRMFQTGTATKNIATGEIIPNPIAYQLVYAFSPVTGGFITCELDSVEGVKDRDQYQKFLSESKNEVLRAYLLSEVEKPTRKSEKFFNPQFAEDIMRKNGVLLTFIETLIDREANEYQEGLTEILTAVSSMEKEIDQIQTQDAFTAALRKYLPGIEQFDAALQAVVPDTGTNILYKLLPGTREFIDAVKREVSAQVKNRCDMYSLSYDIRVHFIAALADALINPSRYGVARDYAEQKAAQEAAINTIKDKIKELENKEIADYKKRQQRFATLLAEQKLRDKQQHIPIPLPPAQHANKTELAKSAETAIVAEPAKAAAELKKYRIQNGVTLIEVQFPDNITIAEVKDLIKKKLSNGTLVDLLAQYSLCLGGQELRDSAIVADCHFTKHTTIHLTQKSQLKITRTVNFPGEVVSTPTRSVSVSTSEASKNPVASIQPQPPQSVPVLPRRVLADIEIETNLGYIREHFEEHVTLKLDSLSLQDLQSVVKILSRVNQGLLYAEYLDIKHFKAVFFPNGDGAQIQTIRRSTGPYTAEVPKEGSIFGRFIYSPNNMPVQKQKSPQLSPFEMHFFPELSKLLFKLFNLLKSDLTEARKTVVDDFFKQLQTEMEALANRNKLHQ